MLTTDYINSNDKVIEIGKSVTALTDNTFVDVATVAIPNVTTRVAIELSIYSALGAGGAVGAGEATGVNHYSFAVTKFLGAVSVIGASSAWGTASALSGGSDAVSITTTAQASAVTGAGGVAQTFTLQVKVAKGGGASAAHTAKIVIKALILDGSGVNIY